MRPSWHVDLKWLCGLGLLASVVAASALYSLTTLTAHDPATGLFSAGASYVLKDEAGEEARLRFAEMQQRAAADPDAYVTLDGITLPLTGADVAGLTYDQAVDLAVAQTAEILYRDGPDAALQYFEDGAEEAAAGEESGPPDAGPLVVLTQSSHDNLSLAFRIALAPLGMLALAVVFFSRRFGRLGSPGLIAAVGLAPFAAGWALIEQAAADPGDGIRAELAAAIAPTVDGLAGTFLRLLLVALAAVAISIAGHVASLLWPRMRGLIRTRDPHVETPLQPDEPAQDLAA